MTTNTTKQIESSNDVYERIKKNYQLLNQMMSEEIDIASEHGVLSGSFREGMWMKFFRSIIPKKYSLAQGVMIIDSNNGISKEIDIVVYDEAYTPYVFQYNTIKYIPIEAVAVVIECKSDSWDDAKLKDWSKSVTDLVPKASGVARMATGYSCGITNLTQKRTRPIIILASNMKRSQEKTIKKRAQELQEHFDFILLKNLRENKEERSEEFTLQTSFEKMTLGWWGRRLNGAENEDTDQVKDELKLQVPQVVAKLKLIEKAKECNEYKELRISDTCDGLLNTLADLRVPGNELLTLNLQLNQLLMLLNNPMLFPHFAYAKAFGAMNESDKNQGEEGTT